MANRWDNFSDLEVEAIQLTLINPGKFGNDISQCQDSLFNEVNEEIKNRRNEVFVPCYCESSLCDHEGKCDRRANPKLHMAYVGNTCTQCASNMCDTGGEQYITNGI